MVNTEIHGGPGSPTSLRLANQQRVVGAIVQSSSGLSQAEISRRTGLAPATVSNIVRELSEADVLYLGRLGSGRRGNVVTLSPTLGYALGVCVERAGVSVGLATLDQNVVAVRSVSLEVGYEPPLAFTQARQIFDELLADQQIAADQVVGACLTIPSLVSSDGLITGATTMFSKWYNQNLPEMFARSFGYPLVIENDANAGALAEHLWGAGVQCQDLVFVQNTAGVGCGLVLGGQLFRGSSGIAGEIGHFPLPGFDQVCACGNRGCLESLVSIPAILSQVQQVVPTISSFSQVVSLAQQGNALCLRRLEEASALLGRALVYVCNLFNPGCVVLGGVFAEAAPFAIPIIHDYLQAHCLTEVADAVQIVPAQLGLQAPLRGAMARAVNMVDFEQLLRGSLEIS